MKKSILSLILVSCFIFAGFEKAFATPATANITNTSATNAAANPLTSQLNGVVYSMSVSNTGTTAGSLTAESFTSTTSLATAPSAITGTYTIWYQTAAQGAAFTGGGTALGSIPAPAGAGASLSFTSTIPLPRTSTTYVFLVANISIPNTAGNITFGYNSVTTTATLTAPATTAGTAYAWSAATTVTLTSFKTPGVNGLAYNPLSTNVVNPAVYGFSLTGGAAGAGIGNATISSITLTNPTNATSPDNAEVNSTMTLWSSPTPTLNINTPGTTATQLVQVNVNAAAGYGPAVVFTPATPISVAPGSVTYYFVTYDNAYYSGAGYTTTQQNYSSSTGSPITAGAQTTGFLYTIGNGTAVPTITAANDAAGLSPVSPGTIYQGTSGYALSGLTLKTNAGTANVSNITFNYTISGGGTFAQYFGAPQLYSSSSTTFGTATLVSTAVPTVGASTISFAIDPTTPTFGTAGTTYYLVINYTGASTGATATFVPAVYTTSSYNDKPVTPAAYPVNTYSCQPPPTYVTATASSLTTTAGSNGTYSSTTINAAGTYTIYGMKIAASATGTSVGITALNFTTSNALGNSNFYGTAYLYAGTAAGPTGAALTSVTTTASQALNFTGLAGQTLAAGATLYYYVEIAYSSPGTSPSAATTLSFVSATTPLSPAAITNGAAVDGPAYTYGPVPVVTAMNIPSADLSNSVIFVGQKNIVLAGLSLAINTGFTPLTKLTFSYNVSLAMLAQYFTASTVHIVASTMPLTSPFSATDTTDVPVSSINTATSGSIICNITGTNVTTTTTYYYLVADYTVTGGATPQPIKFAASGYTTTLSGAVTTGYATNTFTCTTPTYYWTGTAGDNNWTTAGNWEVTTAGFVNGYYPGQIYASKPASTPDNVDIAPVVTAPTINLASNITVADIAFEKGVNTVLNINGAAIKLNVKTELDLGSTTSGAASSSLTLGGGGILDINADAELNYSSNLIVPVNGNLTLDNNAFIDLNGTTGQIAKITLSGGTIVSNGGNYEFIGSSALLTATAGTFNALNNTYLDLTAANDQIINNGATFNITDSNDFSADASSANVTNTSGTLNIINTNFLLTPGSFTVGGGIVNITSDAGGSSLLQLGGFNINSFTFNITAGTGTVSVTGGTVNVSGASEVHTELTTASTFTNNGGSVNFSGNSYLFADYAAFINTSGTVNVDASTIGLAVGGTSLTNAGTFNCTGGSVINYTYNSSVLSNTGTFNTANTTINFNANNCGLSNTAGLFNFGAASVINLASNNCTVSNSGSGTFTCAPTSIMNLTDAVAANKAPTVNNSSTNPFTLLSDATGSATIGKIAAIATSGSFIGPFNVQRYISTASRNYRLLASPVNKSQPLPGTAGAPNLIDISALGQTVTSPATYNGAYIGGPGAGFIHHVANPLLYLYQETLLPAANENSTFTSGKNVGIIDITTGTPYTVSTMSTATGGQTPSDNSTTVKIPPGNAYLLYYIHDNTSAIVTDPLTTATTTATGFINQGTVPFILWGSGTLTTAMTLTTTAGVLYPGVTMVGNPYASTIDLQQVFKDNDVAGTGIFTNGVGEAFYELDPTSEQFVSYNYSGSGTGTLSGSTASRYIASGQGFYVTVVNNGKTMNFAEDQKTPSTTTPTFPSPLLENFPANPGTTVDNVSPGNGFKTTDAVLHTRGTFNNTAAVKNAALSAPVKINTLTAANAATKYVSDTLITKTGKVVIYQAPADTKVYAQTKPDTTTKHTPPVSTLMGLHLKLVKDSVTFDECGLYFANRFVDNVDNNDALDLDGTGGKVFLSSYSSDRKRTSINAMNMFTSKGKRIPLFVKFSASGLYSLGMEDIANFNDNYSVFLIDNMLKDSLDLTLYKSYNFNYTAGTGGDSTRFVLAIEHKPIPHYALLSFAGEKVTPGVQLNWKTLNEGNITTFVLQKLSANNTYAFLDSLHSDSAGDYSYVDQHPVLGNNIYRLQQTDGLGNITYSAPVTIGYNSTNPNGGLTIYPNPAKSTMTVTLATSSTATTVATADIYNTSGKLIAHKVVNSNSFVHDVSGYDLGVYIIELKNSNGVLVGKSKFVKVN